MTRFASLHFASVRNEYQRVLHPYEFWLRKIPLFPKNHIGGSFYLDTSMGSGPYLKKKTRVKIFRLTGVPIWLLTTKKFFNQIVKNIMDKLWISFKQFLMSLLSARSNLVNCFLKKNLTSNGSKPLGVLTSWTSSCSDKCLPIDYLP